MKPPIEPSSIPAKTANPKSQRVAVAPGGVALFLCLICATLARAQFTPPTPEELSMTSQPEVPGAPAVYLFREEITDDKLHTYSIRGRIKILNERGKDYADVDLGRFWTTSDAKGFYSELHARTIQPDGSIVPFTGKPLEKLVEKSGDYRRMEELITLPAVQVGSIIEFEYTRRSETDASHLLNFSVAAPQWEVQSRLFTRKAHFYWRPSDKLLTSSSERGSPLVSRVAWTSVLPKDADFKTAQGADLVDELTVRNVPPLPSEELMPPLNIVSYHVLFFYTSYKTADEFWDKEGKGWSKARDKFIGPNAKVKAAVSQLVANADTPDQKLRKIYAAMMQFENTDYTRNHSAAEDRAEDGHETKSTEEVLEAKRGTASQLADLFVAMARAAGLKAYLMTVCSRNHNLFNPNNLNFDQFDSFIAIVNIDGQDKFFDPGERYCPYGHLAWKHTLVQGIRQTEAGTAIALTPAELYTASKTQRVADLIMDDHGLVAGSVKLTFIGAPALRWRQAFLTGDENSLKNGLRRYLETRLPQGMEVRVENVDKLDEYEQPLVVSYFVKGPIGVFTGKRNVIVGDIFVASTSPVFPHDKRDLPVYFSYPDMVLDAVRLSLPPNTNVESAPSPAKISFKKAGFYSLASETTPNTITFRRELDVSGIIYAPSEYPDLRGFYNNFESKDKEPTLLRFATSPTGN